MSKKYELIIKRGKWCKPPPWHTGLELEVARKCAIPYRNMKLQVMVVPVGTWEEGHKRAPSSSPHPHSPVGTHSFSRMGRLVDR